MCHFFSKESLRKSHNVFLIIGCVDRRNILISDNILIQDFDLQIGTVFVFLQKKRAKLSVESGSYAHRTINKFNKKEDLNLFESIKTFELRFGSFEWVDLGKQLGEEEERGNFYYIFSLNETHSSDFTPHAVGVEMNIKKFSSIHFERMFIVLCLSASFQSI